METDTALVGADGVVELNAIADIVLNFTFVVHPGNAESEDAVGLYHTLDDAGFFKLGVLVVYVFNADEHLFHSLEEFFYLDRLVPGGDGIVTLKVELDGETQGNTYQNTLASLQMNFAVEKAVATQEPGGEGGTPGNQDSLSDDDSQGNPPVQ